jgi:uncharacterized protein YjbK
MPVRQEVEIKLGLKSRAHYERLCRELGTPEEAWEQVNHYFRSEDGRIPGEEGVIRIRLEKGKAVFTVKLGALRKGLARAEEYEEDWSGPPDRIPESAGAIWETGHAGLAALERRVGGRLPLVWLGKMVNLRRLYRSADGLWMEVDASRYPDGREDYEVEVESGDPDRDRPVLESLLRSLGIAFVPQTATKYQRFLMHLEWGKPPPHAP